jgi:hypothetical protein
VVGDVGLRERGRLEREHSCDVERDVPVPITTARSQERSGVQRRVIGVAVLAADERGRRDRAGQHLPADAERPGCMRADCLDDRAVTGAELLRQVTGDLEVAEERKPGLAAICSNTRDTDLIFG